MVRWIPMVMVWVVGCSVGQPVYQSSSEGVALNEPAMSTSLDRRDVTYLYEENVRALKANGALSRLKTGSTVVAAPIVNLTSEHVGSQLDALLSRMERELVVDERVSVVAGRGHHAEALLRDGGRWGAGYVLQGRVVDAAERTAAYRRVQYFMFMQIVEVETGLVMWQHASEVTKKLVTEGGG